MSDYITDGKGRNTMVKKLQPKLRFRGFTDAWEQRELKTLMKEVDEISSDGEILSVTVANGIYPARNGAKESNPGESINRYKVVRIDDIVYNSMRLWQGAIGISDYKGIVSPAYTVCQVKQGADARFCAYLLRRYPVLCEFYKYSQGNSKDTLILKYPEFSRITVTISPSIIEQHEIANALERIDSLIAAEKRKLLLLEQKREAYSQKVFSYGSHHGEDAKHWKTMRLGDIATRITRRNKGRSNLPLTISARDGLIDQRHFFSKQVASKNLDNYILLQRGEFAYNKSTSSDSPWGTIKCLGRYDQGCVSTLYICFSTHSVDPQFITTLFNSPIWHREIQAIATEGARNHGLLNISPKDFFDIQLQIPDSLSEQKHIGRFFAAYEQLIRQTAKRIGLLEKKKKALLQTMFI